MKRSSILLLLLASTLQLVAQARLTVNKESYDLGQVEWSKPVTVEYTLTNSGDIPLVIANVTTSCACTVASWPKMPIQPGQTGQVRVNFDAMALGQFYKEIEIYSNSTPNIVYLNFSGEVVREITDFSRTHRVKIGDLRVDKSSLDFGDVVLGKQPSLKIEVVNESDTPYAPVLMHTPSYLHVQASDLYLQKGERGEFTVVLDTDQIYNYGYCESNVYLSRFAGDKVSNANKLPLSYTLLPDLAESKEDLSLRIPSLELDKQSIDLENEFQNKRKITDQITLLNQGKADLEILKLQTFSPAVELKLSDTSVKSGEFTKLKIKIDQNKVLSDTDNFDILLITNDPYHTKTIIKVNH